jgi:hypothetical protein
VAKAALGSIIINSREKIDHHTETAENLGAEYPRKRLLR